MLHGHSNTESSESSSSGFFREDNAHIHRHGYKDPMHHESIISNMLRKNLVNTPMDLNLSFSSRAQGRCSSAECIQEDGEGSISSKDGGSHFSSPQRPTPYVYEAGQLFSQHLQAKRARVESIIRGMSFAPGNISLGIERIEEREQSLMKEEENPVESKRKRRLVSPISHLLKESTRPSWESNKEEECQQLKKRLRALQRQLRQLQKKFVHVHELSDSDQSQQRSEITKQANLKEAFHIHRDKNPLFDGYQDLVWRPVSEIKVSEGESFCNVKRFSQILKQELSTAIAQTVDTVFKEFPSNLGQVALKPSTPHAPIPAENGIASPLPREVLLGGNPSRKSLSRSCHQNSVSSPAQTQSEALSLVKNKSLNSPSPPTSPQLTRRSYKYPQVSLSYPLAMAPQVQETHILSHLLGCNQTGQLSSSPRVHSSSPDRSSPGSVDLPWEAIPLKSGTNSYHMSHQPCELHFRSSPVESYGLPQLKEGLNPGHLKKAKLMFFFTRYPSSNILKTYFPDVKFNRCITSQLIKWFSNFREFYYIQMEKFARQAVAEGAADASELTVGRTSELYRTLNMHYNKANDFQVPEQFLEIATVTLREFFEAIISRKDLDPSWKKSIYKVIAKLDCEIPDTFQSPGFLQEILQS
ncbi:prospero homeobox protein 2 [Pleurodeles waltl]|uniref:prospero homeobox protein 2 n=1 Tax=Pleurodeles waltl TaxID=8319 RepID=UPI0037097B52